MLQTINMIYCQKPARDLCFKVEYSLDCCCAKILCRGKIVKALEVAIINFSWYWNSSLQSFALESAVARELQQETI